MTQSLDDRMKQYEYVTRTYLTRKIPAIIRIDGKAFRTFTRGLQKPFDRVFMTAMQMTMKSLCEQIQGCVFGYTQSDEITLVLTDYANEKTDAWFGYNIQKMASIAASMATMYFNKHFKDAVALWRSENRTETSESGDYLTALCKQYDCAMFDARVFSLPKEEVCNCLIWRQRDAVRNSVQAVGQAYFSAKQMEGKSNAEVKEMLSREYGVEWERFFNDCKRGACCRREVRRVEMDNPRCPGMRITVERSVWVIDRDTPLFSECRAYVEGRL